MAKKQNSGNPQSSIQKEIGMVKRANPSSAVDYESALLETRSTTDIRPRKDVPDEVSTNGSLETADAQNGATGAILEPDQPLIVAQAVSPPKMPPEGRISGDAGAVLADAQNVILADAAGTGSGLGQSASEGEVIPAGKGGWWLMGGIAALGVGAGIAASNSGGGGSGGTSVNEAPVISSNGGGPSASLSVSENQTAVTTVTATDANAGDGKTFSITGGADASKFQINTATGVLNFITTPNFEAPADAGGNNVYDVQVTVTDTAGLTDVQVLAVTVTGVNDNSPVFTSATTANVAENSTAVLNVAATDADLPGQTVTYSITGGADAARFQIDVASGALTFVSAPNYESPVDAGANNVYDVQVTVTDTAGLTDVQDLAVTVTGVNEAPTVTAPNSGNAVTMNVAENSTAVADVNAADADTGQTITYSLSGADAALFSIDASTGVVAFATPPDFEAPADSGADNLYNFTVIATDNGTGNLTDSQAFAVTVTDVYDTVVVEQSGAWIDLNANGVRDAADTIAADFTSGSGNVDLANNPVTIHFNDAPNTSINLTGFTSDDKIELDVNSFNGHLMPSTPAHSLNSYFNSVPSRLFLHMDNSGSFGLFSATPFSGLAFNRGGTAVLAYWTDNPGNPLLDINNIMPGVVTSGGVVVSGGSAALSALNQGAGHGILVDFLWPTPLTLQVVIDGTGAYLDANANGIVDAGEVRANMGGDVDMSFNHVTVHFNDVPNGDINLSGFGADDLIEIDAQAFIDNGHNVLQILSLTNVITLDGFTANGSFPAPTTSPTVTNWRFSGSYGNSHLRQTGYTTFGGQMNRWVNQGLYTSSSRLNFYSNNGSSSNSWQLATQLPSSVPLQQLVDYVNLPVALDPVHVVVEQNGAVIDFDGDGVRDNGENWLADFGSGGNADLANSVVIRFNDIPMSALHLNGFGTDDKIEIAAGDSWLAGFSAGTSSVNYQLAHLSGSPLATVTTMIRVNQFTALTLHDFNNNTYPFSTSSGAYALSASTPGFNGAIAYWTDATNALNNQTNLLPDNFGPSPISHTAVLANLNANHYPGLVEFVWPVHVVVDDQAGNVATFFDANANGVRDTGEDTLALLGQTQAAVDAFNTVAGTSYGSQAIDLASEQVTIHYNELPAGAWMPDLTGFGGNDRIEIDVDAMRNGQTGKVLTTQSSYNANTWVDSAGVTGGTHWNSAMFTLSAVFLAGSRLKYGHTDSSNFTVTAINEGTIASNAAALANHYNQQVAFVANLSPI